MFTKHAITTSVSEKGWDVDGRQVMDINFENAIKISNNVASRVCDQP
jgi:hypothetical protein